MKFGEYLKKQRDARGWTQPMAAADRGAYYIEPVAGGRRVFEKTGLWRHVPPRLNGHLAHALALAMLLFGFGGLFVARRW